MLLFGSLTLASIAAQNRPVILDAAITGAHAKIESVLAPGTKIIVLNFTAPASRLSDYVIDQLIAKLVNNRNLIVVERKDLELINQEMAFQLSGEVSDESAQAIGRKLGAQSIASGKFETLGDDYQFSIKTINVETAAIELFYQTFIRQDRRLDTLLGITAQKEAERKEKEAERKEKAAQEKAAKQSAQNARVQQAASRNTKLILGLRGGLSGFSILGNQAAEDFSGFDVKPLFPEQVYSLYFGTNSLNSLLGFQMEANFHVNSGIEASLLSETYKMSYTSLDIPLLIRLGVGGGGMFSLFVGPYMSIPLTELHFVEAGDDESEDEEIARSLGFISTYGILGGLTMGFKVGPGFIALDGRYSYDFNYVTVQDDGSDMKLFRRRGFTFSLGYELWL
jgi:TolB-like protein